MENSCGPRASSCAQNYRTINTRRCQCSAERGSGGHLLALQVALQLCGRRALVARPRQAQRRHGARSLQRGVVIRKGCARGLQALRNCLHGCMCQVIVQLQELLLDFLYLRP